MTPRRFAPLLLCSPDHGRGHRAVVAVDRQDRFGIRYELAPSCVQRGLELPDHRPAGTLGQCRRLRPVAAQRRPGGRPDHAVDSDPVIRGWAACYRGVVSSRLFGSLDDYLWRLTCKWATWRHNNKPKRWIVGRYLGKFNKFRNDRWVFGDRDSGTCLVKFS